MRRITLCFTIAFIAMTFQMLAQHHDHFRCGISAQDGEEIKQNMLQTRAEMRDFVRPRNITTYVPVRFWMMAKTNGDGRASEEVGLKTICELNENYLDQDIQFYLHEFEYWNNTSVYNDPQSFASVNTIKGKLLNTSSYDAINIFILDDAGGGAAAYFQLPMGQNGNDWIVSGDNYAGDGHSLTHEVGHFFNLPHPFNGWESTQDGWDPAIHGNPVGTYSPDNVLNELVNGTNCQQAGDAICDTPADYMFPFPGSNQCTYNLDAMDPTGVLLEPVINNFMNYGNCNSYFFTDGQKQEIENSLYSPQRDYVNPGDIPILDIVDQTPTVIAPGSGETVETYNSVELEWSEVPGATHYLVKIILPNVGTDILMVETTSMLLTDLEPNSTYFWQVRAFNEYSTCKGFSSQKIFKTGGTFTDTADVPNIDEWSIFPNPARNGGVIEVSVESTDGLEATVRMYSITGQLVHDADKVQFPAGMSTLEIPVSNFGTGVYMVTLQSENGLETKRVSIVD